MPDLTPCLWFDTEGEEAAELYTSLFDNSKITGVTRYGPAGPGPEGSVMTVNFELDGHPFLALNGGPMFTFSEAISFQIPCETQEEIDRYWDGLSAEGEESQCGWLKDKFGVSWQVIPAQLEELLGGPDPERSQRAMQAMFGMKKLDIEALRNA